MSNFNLDKLIDLLSTAIADRINSTIPIQTIEVQKEEEFKTRKETAEMLSISLPTLHQYTKKGILLGYRVGARVLYKQSEIEAALSKMNFGRN